MKKILSSILLLAILGLVTNVYALDDPAADINQARDGRVIPYTHPGFVGADVYFLNASSAAVMVTSPTYTANSGSGVLANPAPRKTRGILYGFIFSSLTATTDAYVVVRDSTTPSRDTTHLMCPEIMQPMEAVNKQLVIFDPPLKFGNGLSVALGEAGVATTGSVSVIYRKE